MSAPDLTREEFECLFDTEAALDPAARAILATYGIVPFRAEYAFEGMSGATRLPVWIVARSVNLVLGYDEVEEEYGIGQVDPGGQLADWGTFGEGLQRSLMRFPDASHSIR